MEIKQNPKCEKSGSYSYWFDFAEKEKMIEILKKYNIISLEKFQPKNYREIRATSKSPIYVFPLNSKCGRVYRPNQQKFYSKYNWFGEKPEGFSNVFGLEQLPNHCKTILIVEGFKDLLVGNANLNDEDIYVIGLDYPKFIDSKTVNPLKSKCDFLVLCFNTDEEGQEFAQNISSKFGIRNFKLPKILEEHSGRDLADWFSIKLDNTLLINYLEDVTKLPEPFQKFDSYSENSVLDTLLKIQSIVCMNASKEIIQSPPLVERMGTPIFRKGTINIIQGKFGSHKTRITELFCSLMLSKNDSDDFLGFKKSVDEPIAVIYVDTERNTAEEFPLGIQSIKTKAGYELDENTDNFSYTSIKTIPRNKRLGAIKIFIEYIKKNTQNRIFVVLDVTTDCIGNFNDPKESMELYDYLGVLTEQFNATFLIIIHENPTTNKARGHLGTEGGNKASTVLSIGFEQKNNESTGLIMLKFVKLRTAKRPETLYLRYSDEYNGLRLIDKEFLNLLFEKRRQQVDIELVIEFLGDTMNEPRVYNQKELLPILIDEFKCSANTMKSRLNEIEAQKKEITNINSEPCNLIINSINGSQTTYSLVAADL